MSNNAVPTKQHLEWAECEIGVIIHQDLQVYETGYHYSKDWNYTPSAAKFNPSSLDTDQWLAAAASLGAKYAVLVAKHCSGFSLWPTKAHDYSVASSPWRGGRGDVVADFIESCRKYSIRPGLYASCGNNAKFKVGASRLVDGFNAEKWDAYVKMVKTQLRELWTNYGDIFEVWFDGGFLPYDNGGREIVEMLAELQPDAIVFQGSPEHNKCIRWIGNERSDAPYPCWSRTDSLTQV